MGRALSGALALFAMCGCWYRLGNATGSVDLSWSFNGGLNCGTAGVTQVTVSGAGPSMTFACTDQVDSTFATGTLPEAPAGSQTLVLTGFGSIYDSDAGTARPQPVYRGSFTFDISEAADNVVGPVDLAPLAPAGSNGDLLVLWSFGGRSCAAAAVQDVTVVLDGGALVVREKFSATGTEVTVPCHANGQDGFRIRGLTQNLYSFPMSAASAKTAFVAAPTAYVTGFTETVQHVDLHPIQQEALPGADGGNGVNLTLLFGLTDGGDCASTGVETLQIQLLNTELIGLGASIDGVPTPISEDTALALSNTVPCEAAFDSGVTISTTYPSGLPCTSFASPDAVCLGEYHLMVQGLTSAGVAYLLNDYDLWVDQGLTDGATAGVVPQYGDFPFLGALPDVTAVYALDLPLVSGAQ